MKPNGWIPREQIRGPEAESNVPSEFLTQDSKLANPPSMMFSMRYLVEEVKKGDIKLSKFLLGLFSKWQLWYNWFLKS
jgi:mannosyl-oligosaccharide glucosidase